MDDFNFSLSDATNLFNGVSQAFKKPTSTTVAAPVKATEKTFMQKYGLYIGIGAVVLVAGGFLVMRRK